MPELPEMENYKRLLTENIRGHIVTDIEINREKSIGVPVAEFKRRVEGHAIVGVSRRAKHLIFTLDSGDVLLLHLMLGGWMFYGSADERPEHTCQVVLSFGRENLYFIGLRLGYLHLLTPAEMAVKLSKLGPEPFDNALTPTRFHQLLMKRDGALKAKLTDQHLIAGIGNRYSDEICFAAGVLPLRSTHSLHPQEVETLYRAMQTTLRHAIEAGGYMATPFSVNDRLTGRYADEFFVYNRGDEPCKVCTNPIVRKDYSGRKVFYCPQCQH